MNVIGVSPLLSYPCGARGLGGASHYSLRVSWVKSNLYQVSLAVLGIGTHIQARDGDTVRGRGAGQMTACVSLNLYTRDVLTIIFPVQQLDCHFKSLWQAYFTLWRLIISTIYTIYNFEGLSVGILQIIKADRSGGRASKDVRMA